MIFQDRLCKAVLGKVKETNHSCYLFVYVYVHFDLKAIECFVEVISYKR